MIYGSKNNQNQQQQLIYFYYSTYKTHVMKQDSEVTKVVFRKYSDGQILALFPYEKETKHFCQSYMHIGQHSGADYAHCIRVTKPAIPSEYEPLRRELTGIGYNLQVIQKKSNK